MYVYTYTYIYIYIYVSSQVQVSQGFHNDFVMIPEREHVNAGKRKTDARFAWM